MPDPSTNYFNIKRLNRLFALSAILMLATFLWAIWHDHDRPWRRIQQQDRQWSIARIDARLAMLRSNPTGHEAEIDSLMRRRTQLVPQGFWAGLGERLRSVPLLQFINPRERIHQVVLADVHTDLSFTRAPTTDRCVTCHVNIDRKESSRANIIEMLENQVGAGAVAMPEFWFSWGLHLKPPAATKANAPRLKTLADTIGPGTPTQPVQVTIAGAAVAKLDFKIDQFDDRQRAALLQVLKFWLLVDQPAPGTQIAGDNGTIIVKVATPIDPAILKKAKFAAAKIVETYRTSLAGELDARTARRIEEKYRFALVHRLNSIRKSQGQKTLDPSPVFLAHPRLDLYAHIDTPHAIEKIGCTSCHDGSGNETDFVLAAHRARPILVDALTGEPILPSQLLPAGTSSIQSYLDPVTGRKGMAVSQLSHWKSRYQRESPSTFDEVAHNWDFPMRQSQYIQASCARCHANISDIAKEAPLLHEGRALFTRMGCVNCHQMDSIPTDDPNDRRTGDQRRAGGDLRNLPAKLSPAFVNTWLWSPKTFRPGTLMPHFFGLANNSSAEDMRRSRVESLAMTQYLMAAANQSHQTNPPLSPEIARGNAVKGQELFEKLGCAACHTNLADPVDWDDPDTKQEPIRRRAEDWIVTDLVQRTGISESQAQSIYQKMDYNQKQRYCLEQFGSLTSSEARTAYPDGTPRPRFIIFAPELSGVGDKLMAGRSREQATAWLAGWLTNPRHYSATTIMPNLRLSQTETGHLVQYLLRQTRKNLDPRDAFKSELFAIDRPKLTELVAWFLRVQYSPEQAATMAMQEKTADGRPGEITLRAADALTSPSSLSAPEARAAVATMPLEQKQLLFLGKKLVAHYGCFNCHAINGMENIASPCPNLSEWGQKSANKLDFGTTPLHNASQQASPSRESWLETKLDSPRIFDRNTGRPYEGLRMPRFFFNPAQIQALVTFVTSNRDRLIADRMLASVNNTHRTRLALGRQAVERFNCTSCHIIHDNDPAITQYFSAQRQTMNEYWLAAPPNLVNQGSRTQPGWLFSFLKNVEPIRPRLQARMPSYHLSDNEAQTLTAYFAATAQEQSRWLKTRLVPIERYIASKERAATRPADPLLPWPGDDWHVQPALEQPTRELEQWALARRLPQMSAANLDPAKTTGAEADRIHRTLLFHARFLDDLLDAPYPLVESPRPQIAPAAFHKGEAFFRELACLQCHMFTSTDTPPQSAIPNPQSAMPIAPNLANAHRRLQWRWADHWVQQTNIVLPVGSPMPPFFNGLPAWNLTGLPAGQDAATLAAMPDQKRQKSESLMHQFGATAPEQKTLLLNFIFSAGARHYTVTAATQPSPNR